MDDLDSSKPKLPSIIGLEGIADPATKRFALAVKEILEIYTGTRPQVSDLDSVLTKRDLYTYNLASFVVNGQVITNPTPSGNIIGNAGSSNGSGSGAVIDLTPPGAPLGLLATGTKLAVLLEWNAPLTEVAYTEVVRASINDIGQAILLGTTTATVYADIIGATNVTNYYWIRFVSTANIKGAYNAIAGTVATTGKIGTNDLISVDGAKIIDATILNAKIANVSADKITTGTIAVGQAIQVGAAANRIFIDGNGIIRSGGMLDYLNGNGFYLRATAGSAQVSFGNATNYIGFNGTNISIDTPNFKILDDALTFNGSGTFSGNLAAATGTFSGALEAATGTFSGNLQAATGTFNGTLLAGVLDLNSAIGETHIFELANSGATVIAPTGKSTMRVTLYGGAGGGAGGGNPGPEAFNGSGGGGGGGGVDSSSYTQSNITAGTVYKIIVGAGGLGGYGAPQGANAQGGNGSNGSASTLSLNASGAVLITSQGAFGGLSGADYPQYISGGVGGNGTSAQAKGGSGGSGSSFRFRGFGGTGGVGTSITGGAGGLGGNIQTAGAAGKRGADGKVIVEFFNPNSVVLQTQYSNLKAQLAAQFGYVNTGGAA